jgi:hypothetical protein
MVVPGVQDLRERKGDDDDQQEEQGKRFSQGVCPLPPQGPSVA